MLMLVTKDDRATRSVYETFSLLGEFDNWAEHHGKELEDYFAFVVIGGHPKLVQSNKYDKAGDLLKRVRDKWIAKAGAENIR